MFDMPNLENVGENKRQIYNNKLLDIPLSDICTSEEVENTCTQVSNGVDIYQKFESTDSGDLHF